jgi:DNA-binding transcriptional regulator YiaG
MQNDEIEKKIKKSRKKIKLSKEAFAKKYQSSKNNLIRKC